MKRRADRTLAEFHGLYPYGGLTPVPRRRSQRIVVWAVLLALLCIVGKVWPQQPYTTGGPTNWTTRYIVFSGTDRGPLLGCSTNIWYGDDDIFHPPGERWHTNITCGYEWYRAKYQTQDVHRAYDWVVRWGSNAFVMGKGAYVVTAPLSNGAWATGWYDVGGNFVLDVEGIGAVWMTGHASNALHGVYRQ